MKLHQHLRSLLSISKTSNGGSYSPLQDAHQLTSVPYYLSHMLGEEPPGQACQCHATPLQYLYREQFLQAELSSMQSGFMYGTACQIT